MGFTESESRTLAALCDTFVPSLGGEVDAEFFARSASSLGVPKTLEEIIETRLPRHFRNQFHTLLKAMDSQMYNLVLTGRPVRFSDLDPRERESYLGRWRDSRLGLKRTGFQALKRFSCFLAYSLNQGASVNPNLSSIGYLPNHGKPVPHPKELSIRGMVPRAGQVLNCDVCIIGSGPGGSVIAYELSKAGLDTVVVEAGEYQTAEDFERGEMPGSLIPRIFYDYASALTRDLAFTLLSGRGAGGGSVLNWNTCMRPPDHVLHEWEDEFGIAGLTGTTFSGYTDSIMATLHANAMESQRNANNEALWRGCRALGYTEGTDYEVIMRNAVGCDQRCTLCTFGCAYSCKQSTLMNLLPSAYKSGARFLFKTKAELLVVRGGMVRDVQCSFASDGEAGTLVVRPKVVVVAAGAINTPALLLRSGIRGKNVGKNLRLHPTTALAGLFDRPQHSWEGPPQTVAVRRFSNLDGSGHGFWLEAVPPYPGILAMSLPWESGRQHKDFMRSKFSRAVAPIVLLREWGSGEVDIDSDGLPAVRYSLDGRDRRNMIRGLTETARILAAAGARELVSLHSKVTRVEARGERLSERDVSEFAALLEANGAESNRIMMYSAHLMGSCRMSGDESKGVVNPEGCVYGLENLYIGDASVFPTAPGVNPMITIMSMARRIGEKLLTKLRGA